MSEWREFETGEQAYSNCKFSAGRVLNHPVDEIYLKMERDGEEPTTILLRADEALAIVWLLGGALWSREQSKLA